MRDGEEFLKFILAMSEKDVANYRKYSKVRSKELYYYLSRFLHYYYDKPQIEYEIVSQWVRFDKDVKNVLYRFYATFEEYFKTVILEKIEVSKNNKFIERNISDKNFPNENLMKALNVDYIDVFKHKNILNFFNAVKFSSLDLPFNHEEISQINNLRNKIMHLSFILLPIYDENLNENNIGKEVNDYLAKTNAQIADLINSLPSPWNEYLKEELKTTLKYKDKKTGDFLNRNLDSKLILGIFK